MMPSYDANNNSVRRATVANTNANAAMDDSSTIAFAHAILTIKHQQSLSDSLLRRIRMQCAESNNNKDQTSATGTITRTPSLTGTGAVGPSSQHDTSNATPMNGKFLSPDTASSTTTGTGGRNVSPSENKNASQQSPSKKQLTAGGHEKQVVDHSYTDFSQTSDDMLYELMKNDVRQAEEQSSNASVSSSGGAGTSTNQTRSKQSRSRVNAIGWKMLEDKPGMNVREKLNVLYSNFRRNSGGVVQPFPEKLMELLANPKTQHIVSWMPHGRAFKVHNSKQFIEEVLPSFAGSKNIKYMSFNRQLNLWGFKRLTKGLDNGAYYHELFLRGRPMLAMRMRRHKVKGTGVKLGSNPEMEPNFYTMDLPRLPEIWELDKETTEIADNKASSEGSNRKDDATAKNMDVIDRSSTKEEDAASQETQYDETSVAAESVSTTGGGDPNSNAKQKADAALLVRSDHDGRNTKHPIKKRAFEKTTSKSTSNIHQKPSFDEFGGGGKSGKTARGEHQQEESSAFSQLPFPSPSSLLSESEHHLLKNHNPPQLPSAALKHPYPGFHPSQPATTSDLARQLQLEGLSGREPSLDRSGMPHMAIGQDRTRMLSPSSRNTTGSAGQSASSEAAAAAAVAESTNREIARNEYLLEKQRQELSLLSTMTNMKRQEYELLTKLCLLGDDAISRGLMYRATLAETNTSSNTPATEQDQSAAAVVEAAMLHDHLASIRALQRGEMDRANIPSSDLLRHGATGLDAAAVAAAERINALSSYGSLFQPASATGLLSGAAESSLLRPSEAQSSSSSTMLQGGGSSNLNGSASRAAPPGEAPGSPSMLHAAKRLSFLRCGAAGKVDHHDSAAAARLSFPFK